MLTKRLEYYEVTLLICQYMHLRVVSFSGGGRGGILFLRT